MKAAKETWPATHRPQILIFAVIAVIALVIVGAVSLPAIATAGAFTTLIIGIAAQQSLSNIFAGIVLALAHPFKVGDTIQIHIGILGRPEGTKGIVEAMGIVYTQLLVDSEEIYVPNTTVLNAEVTVEKVPDDGTSPES